MTNPIATYFARKLGMRGSPKLGETARVVGALSGLRAYNPDDLVGRKGYEIYDQMQTDAQVRACLTIKKLSVLNRGWQIRPGGTKPEDERAAEFMRFAIEEMRGSILDVLFNALDALAKGFSIMEMNYKPIDEGPFAGTVGLESIKSKDPASFAFQTDEFLNVTGLKRVGLNDDGRELPREKFVIYSYMPAYESPYGSSDLRAAYKHWWSKDTLMRFLNLYLEKYGSPTAKGSYKRGTPKQAQDDLLRVLEKVQQETAIVIPDDIQVELMEAQRGGEAGYLAALEFHDKQMAKAIVHQTLMTDEGMRVGSFALAKVHLDVLKMCLRKVKRDLEESLMREQVMRPLVEFNFPAAACPIFSLGPVEDKDVEVLAGVITKLVSGELVSPDEAWIREYLGLPEKEAEHGD